jgi:drug/metabolite transporter (DMT)-like permease
MPNWLLFIVPSLIWGTTWLVIKAQLGVVAPEVSVVYRFALASLVLFAWCGVRGISVRFERRQHAAFLLLGLLQYALNYVLVYLSERSVTSGLLAVIFVLIVAWNVLGARLFFGAPLPLRLLAGAALGMLGVTLMFWPEVVQARDNAARSGLLLAVGATLAASAGSLWAQHVYAHRVAIPPSTAWAMLYAALTVAAYCRIRGLPFNLDVSARYFGSLAYLAVFGSVIAFISYLTLIQRVGAGTAGYTSAVVPVLAMLASTVFENYRWSRRTLFGMVLVLCGSIWVLRERQRVSAR